MSTMDIRQKMEELKVLKLECIRKGDFINAAMLRDRIYFYHRQMVKQYTF